MSANLEEVKAPEETPQPEAQPSVIPIDKQSLQQLWGLQEAIHQASRNYKAALFDLCCAAKINPVEYQLNFELGGLVKADSMPPLAPDGPKAEVVKMRAQERKNKRRR